MKKDKIKIIDLFAGVGGLSYGFAKDPDFQIIAANEIDPKIARAYELNNPAVKMYCKDVRDLGLKDLAADFGMKAGDIDLVIGGPPCQAYSTVGKRSAEDPRATLFMEYYRLLKELKPKAFLYENVRGLLSMRGGSLFKEMTELFESLGYTVQHKILNAADFGVPQIRERVIVVGTRPGHDFVYPSPTHSADGQLGEKYLTVADAISDLPFIKTAEESWEYSSAPKNAFQAEMRKNAPEKLMDHSAPKNNEALVRLMEALPDGGTPEDLPKNLKPKSGFKNTYSRLWWNRPSTTITRNLGTPSSSRCIHPKAARALTTREGARLQSFPDDYVFYGSRGDRNLQIGNAVPPLLSVVLKNYIKRHFLSNTGLVSSELGSDQSESLIVSGKYQKFRTLIGRRESRQ